MRKPFVLISWENKALPTFVQYISEHIRKEELINTTFIFPHTRIRWEWEELLKKQFSSQAFFLPHIYTPSQYIDIIYNQYVQKNQHHTHALKSYEEVLLLQEVIEEFQDELGSFYTHFAGLEAPVQYSWLHSIIEVIHEAFLAYKGPDILATLQKESTVEGIYEYFPLLYQIYINKLERSRYTTVEYRIYKSTEYILEHGINYENHKIFLYGFPALSRVEDIFFHTLWEQNDVTICLYTDHSVEKGTRYDSSILQKEWITSWNAGIEYYPYPHHSTQDILDTTDIYEHSSVHSQFTHIHTICEENKGKRIAIIPLESSLLEGLLYYIDTYNVNISIGFPFMHSAVAYLLTSILELQHTRYNGLYDKTVLIRLLQHQYIEGKYKDSPYENSISSYIKKLLSLPELYISLEHDTICLQEDNTTLEMSNFIHGILDLFCHRWESLERYEDVVERIHDIVCFLQEIPEKKLSPIEQAAIACLDIRATEYFKTHITSSSFTGHTIPMVITQYIYLERIPFKNLYKNADIHIVGLSEIQMLSFDIVILLEASEGNLPHKEKDSSFIPSYIKEGIFQIKKTMHTIQKEEYHLHAILNTCNTKYIFYSHGSSKQIGGKEEKSRFIEKIIWKEEKKYQEGRAEQIIKKNEHVHRASPVIYRERIQDINLQEAIYRRLKQGISFSLLNSYLTCPFQFVQRYIFNIDRSKEEESQQSIGLIFHKQLELFFQHYLHRNVHKEELFSAQKRCIETIMEEITYSAGIPMEQKIFAKSIVPKQIELFFEAQPDSFYLEALEVTLSTKIMDFTLSGTIDRIDIREDIYHVIDYKSGKKRIANIKSLLSAVKHGVAYHEYKPILQKSPLQMVTYLYLLHSAYRNIESKGLYYFLAEQDKKKISHEIFASHERCDEEMIVSTFQPILIDIINDISSLEEISCNRGKHCEYCTYRYICL